MGVAGYDISSKRNPPLLLPRFKYPNKDLTKERTRTFRIEMSSCQVSQRIAIHPSFYRIIHKMLIFYFCTVLATLSFSGSSIALPVSKEESSTFQIEGENVPLDWRSLNGSGNNLDNPIWGSIGDEMPNLSSLNFTDNFSSIAHTDFPNPRVISNILCHESEVAYDSNSLSSMNSLWGEFLRNEISLTPHQDSLHEGGMEEAHISIPIDDEVMNPSGSESAQIRYIRTEFIEGTGVDEDNPRSFPNQASVWIDASSIYGQNEETNNWMRYGDGGRVIVTDWEGSDMIPAFDSNGFVNDWDGTSSHINIQFGVADNRNLENIGLSSMHLLFLREHNRLADALQERNPDWTDEQIFQRARKLVIAQIQVITYSEYLPSIGLILPEYSGYNSSINPQLSNEAFLLVTTSFSNQRNDDWLLLNGSREELPENPLELEQGYWNMNPILDYGIEPIIRGASYEIQRENDLGMVENLRNLLSGKSSWPGWMDICAMDIQRGRDRGLTDYNSLRADLGLNRHLSWDNMTSDENRRSIISEIYDDIDSLDALIGVNSEPRVEDSIYGETQYLLALNQYTMLRDADRYWYANDPDLEPLLSELNDTRFADIILRNTEIESIQCNVFLAENSAENFDCELSNIEVENSDDNSPNNYDFGIIIVVLVVTVMAIIVVRKNSDS